MNIAVISDLHGVLPDSVRPILRDVDVILCAGDTCSVDIFEELKTYAPTTMVYGNCDRMMDYGSRVADRLTPSFDGCKFVLVHKIEDVGELPRRTECVITGHTHVPSVETIDGITWLNPGSATEPRHGSHPSMALASVEERELMKVVLVDLTNPGPALREFQSDASFGGFSDYDDLGYAGMRNGGGFSAFNEVDFGEIFQ